MNRHKWVAALALTALLAAVLPTPVRPAHAEDSRLFPQTNHTVKGIFLQYWDTHGGLAQQGYPISEEMQEQSDTDGKVYTMQYFERAVFEMHPENQPPYNVLLSLLGTFYYNQKYGGSAPNQRTSTDNPRKFTETGKTIGGAFRRYWETHGGLAQQGYPISDEFTEVSQTDGKTYTVQYFQRAVFEYHPEFANSPNEVLLSLLGVFFYNQKHGNTPQPTMPPNQPTPTTAPAGPTATATPAPVGSTRQLLFFAGSGAGQPVIIDQQGSIFNQKAFQHNTADWTHVASVGQGYLLFYKIAQGGRVGRLSPEGNYEDIRVGIPYSAGWTSVTGIGNSQVVLFNRATKKLVVEIIGADGTPRDLKTSDGQLPWQIVEGMGENQFYLYLDDPADQFIHKAIARADAAGNITFKYTVTLRPRAGEERGNWLVTALDFNTVLRYQTTTGYYYIETLKDDGSLEVSPQARMEPGYTNITYAQFGTGRNERGVLLMYQSSSGETRTKAVDGNGNIAPLKVYAGSTALPKNWNNLVTVK